jgi:hypothetical protein
MKKLKWLAYYHDFNGDKIKTFNIFDHCAFWSEVEKYLKKCKDKNEFSEKLHGSLFYYFGSKCEWEVVISPWVGGKDQIKIDVYEQVMNNWEVFLDYVWSKGKTTD